MSLFRFIREVNVGMDRSHRYPPRLWLLSCLLTLFILTGCPQTAAPEPIEPTRTPMPTFTPTVAVAEGQVPVVEATATALPVVELPTTAPQAPVTNSVPITTVTGAPTVTVPVTPTVAATPTPAAAEAVVSQDMNVRGGPGTNYPVIGSAPSGTRFVINGKDPTGAWWQVNFNGQAGWLFGELVSANNTSAVAVAQNIPAPPAPTATAIPQPTQPPAAPPTQPPAAQPAPPPAPTNKYKFNVAVVGTCARQPAGNWFEGKTYIGGQPASGYKVVFSYAPDAPPITSPVVSGPHPGYEGWDAGYYSHIINASGPKAGEWYVWVVDDSGARISEIAHWTSTGPGEACNQAVVDFDSR